MRDLVKLGVVAAALFGALDRAEAQTYRRSGGEEPPPFSFHVGAIAEGTDAPIDVSSIHTSPATDPNNSDDANHNIDYTVRHVLLGARVGVRLVPPETGLEVDLDLLLGSVSTALSENIHSLSVHEPQPDDDEHHNTAYDEADFAMGLELRGWYHREDWLRDMLWLGLDYEFLAGSATFNDERFFDDRIDGEYDFFRHRVTVLVGTRLGPVRPYFGIGFFIYDSKVDLEEADRPAPDTWDAEFESEDLFTLRIGAEVADERITGRVDLQLLAELGLGVSFIVRI